MGNYLDVIEECVNNMSPSDVRTHNKNLLALSRLLLSYRSQRSQNDVCSLGGGGGGVFVDMRTSVCVSTRDGD